MVHIDMMYLSMFSIIPAAILGIALFRAMPYPLRILEVFILCTCLIEFSAYAMFMQGKNNMVIYHIHTFVECTAISLIYWQIFGNRTTLKRIILGLWVIFCIFSLFNILYNEDLLHFNSIQRALEYVILMFYFVAFLSIILRSRVAPLLELHPYFTLTIGFFIYFSGTILLFLNANKFIEFGLGNSWFIHGVLNIFLNIIYFVVLWTGTKVVKRL